MTKKMHSKYRNICPACKGIHTIYTWTRFCRDCGETEVLYRSKGCATRAQADQIFSFFDACFMKGSDRCFPSSLLMRLYSRWLAIDEDVLGTKEPLGERLIQGILRDSGIKYMGGTTVGIYEGAGLTPYAQWLLEQNQ